VYKQYDLLEITLTAIINSNFFHKHFGELTSARVDQSATQLTTSWFVGELSLAIHSRYISEI